MKAFVLIVWLAVAGSVYAEDDVWLIVPGKSVGKIAVGMEQSEVFKILGTPAMQNNFAETDRRAFYFLGGRQGEVPIPKGMTQSDWTTSLPVPGKEDSVGYLCDFVTVYVLEAKVVQIEVRPRRFHDAHGLSSASTAAAWRKQYAHTESYFCKCHHPSAAGIPAPKHIFFYEDAAQTGIGWRCDTFTALGGAPDPDDEVDTVIVHAPGEKLLPDPDGGSRFIWKDRPTRRAGD